MSMTHVTIKGHTEVLVLCCSLKSCCRPWLVLLLRALVVSMAHAVAKVYVVPLETMFTSVARAVTRNNM